MKPSSAEPSAEPSAFEENEDKQWRNRQRTLVLCSRGVSHEYRHLAQDLFRLLPHAKKEAKLEKKTAKEDLQDLCEMRSISNVLYLECRKGRDLYLWASKYAQGPSYLFQVQNVNTSH